VIWHDGSLWRYPEFHQHVKEACLHEQLQPLFYDNLRRMCALSSLCGNEWSGHFGYWPRDLAEEAYARVLGVFNGARGLTINRANSYDQRLRIYGAITISYVI
jgi:hypothetical protein